ncbi:BREX-1 system phosphatase PglZ type B, partial [Ilumatobacter sp.]|nr:BREX-1 system phosphatase PglZ type B [Ilumatobacter sp.]
MSDTVLDRIAAALGHASAFDPNAVVAPIAILWPDETRQWESLISELQATQPIITFGPYDLASRQGPAYWLRCVIAGTIELDDAPAGTPIVYLPGISRDAIRSLHEASSDLAPLGALQHRCNWFSHPNGKDWTARALLSNQQVNMGLNIAADAATASALVASLVHLADQRWSLLENKHIDAAYLHGLLNPDITRSLLNWIDDPSATQNGLDDAAWTAFTQQCKQEFGFDPAAGELDAARRLGERDGAWANVWKRFRESPSDYPQIPERLRAAEPDTLFPKGEGAWPKLNEAAEAQLRTALTDLVALTPEGARNELARLELAHRARRSSVWAQLDKTPLANALEYLAELATATNSGPADSSVDGIAHWYADSGWRADRAALRALDEVTAKADVHAVSEALKATYQPWLDTNAKALQAAIGPAANSGAYSSTAAPAPTDGEVVMFIDGLRLDVAHVLADRLDGTGLEHDIAFGFAALPTITETSKPALVPIDQSLLCAGEELDARRAPDGPTAGVHVLRALLADVGVQVLMGDETGDPSGRAWTEAGKLDSRGHELGAEFVHAIDDEVERIARRIEDLLDAGWETITIVTDHGWVLLPGGLPKAELKPALVEKKKGRCARLKDNTPVEVPTVPWHWDPDVRIALAPGISCFEANQTYEHGGVSPQECVVPRMTVHRGAAAV